MPQSRVHALQNQPFTKKQKKQDHRKSQLTEVKAVYSKQISALEAKLIEQQVALGSIREEMTKKLSQEIALVNLSLEAKYKEVLINAKEVCKCMAADLDCVTTQQTMKQTMKNHVYNLIGILDD